MANKFSFKINDTIHQPLRLKIMVFLMVEKQATFPTLEKELEVTPGNLGAHLKILAREELIVIDKYFSNNKPVTKISITPRGEVEMKKYVQELKKFVE